MKRSRILEERRKHVSPETRKSVEQTFQILDRIHEMLTEKGLTSQEPELMEYHKKFEESIIEGLQ